ncbi:MAG: RtcB family protein [bacterium]|nr:MAG: RtcB family protein [bacterium]
MFAAGYELNPITDYVWEISPSGGMRVPGRIYSSRKMIEKYLQTDESVKQVVNVAHLPGIQKYSLAMPDIHWGYGFPIGGVAATDIEEGVISPGGVGYDINCGVRLIRTQLNLDQTEKRLQKLIENLFQSIPTGVGSSGAIHKQSPKEIKKILQKGSSWAVENGFGEATDLQFTEENGCLSQANPEVVSPRAIERGQDQAGTLGSGNHFLEIQVVDQIFDEKAAEIFGLFSGQITVSIHTGSRGLGYQICDDYLKILVKAIPRYGISLPDRQLACAPIQSPEGRDYLGAMAAAANFAWNNRQIIMSLAHKSFVKTLNMNSRDLGFELVYDVCHNVAKIEEHQIGDVRKKVCVHRKGATRAFPPQSSQLPIRYQPVGQPVLVPGDMGRYSFVAVGTQQAMEDTFGSTCHGAGRVQSRHQAIKSGRGMDLIKELKQRGVIIQAKGMKTIAEEMPYAYKDVADVVDVMHHAGISGKVARLRPLAVIKG